MKQIVLIFAEFLLVFSTCFAGKENNVWYFGHKAGLDFNTSPPTPLTNSALDTREGVSSVSDTNGKILFYTSGIRIYNKNHQIMPNGNWLTGHSSSTQSALIVPMPGDVNKYYVFTSEAIENNINGLEYSIVDMTLQTGLGDVSQKNIMINQKAIEKLTAARHINNISAWIVSHEWGNNNFVAYLVNSSGINLNPVISSVGSVYSGLNSYAAGYIRISPDGKKLASAIYGNNSFELFDFNDSTGKISNPIAIHPQVLAGPYGLEFSPDETKLYVSNFNSPKSYLLVYNLLAGTPSDIANSEKVISIEETGFGALQLGPDGKIYLAKEHNKFLGVINKPNQDYPLCNYDSNGVFLSIDTCGLGLPNMIQNYKNIVLTLNSNSPVCEGDTIIITCSTNNSLIYNWTGPNGFISNLKNPEIPDAKDIMTGNYILEITDGNGNKLKYSLFIKVFSSKISFDDINGFNFGVVCEGINLTKSITMTNAGLDSIEIDSIYIKNNTAGFLLINNNPLPFSLDTNGKISISINFAPQNVNIFSDSLIIISNNPCQKRWAIPINGESNPQSINISFDDINSFNFGDVCVGKNLTKIITLTNSSLFSIELDSVFIKNNTTGFLLLNNNPLPIQFDTAGKISFSINFSPQSANIFSDSLIIVSNNICQRRWTIPINGVSNPQSIVSLPDTIAKIGQTDFCVPLKLKLNCREITSATSMPFTTTIYFDTDIFYATSITNGVLEENSISNNIQTLKIRYDNYILQSNDTILTEICGRVLLGSTYTTPLTISNFSSFSDTLMSYGIKNGSITVTGICQPDLRKVAFAPLTKMSVHPNPVSDYLNINLEDVEKGIYSLKILSVTGINLFTNNFSIDDETVKNKNININLDRYASGIYIITLQAPMRYFTIKFMIIK
ncbi:MAG: choice-of-anchor D domain-containing protein [FCB group bacterium]|jgi:hypothetical protein